MKPILIRLVTFLPAALVAMVLSVLALSAQAQSPAVSPGTANPFANPVVNGLAQQILDLPLPAPGAAPGAPAKSASADNAADIENLRVEYVVGEQAGLRLGSGQGAAPQAGGRQWVVHHGEPVFIGGRKYHVTVVRERVRLFEDEVVGGKSRRGELAWAGNLEIRVGQTGAPGAPNPLANQMFVGTNMPSPSGKVISQSVDYGPKGIVAAGGGAGVGMPGAAAAAPAAAVPR